MMKKYKFLFLTLILGFFFFLPDDVFALEIQAYDSSGKLAYRSKSSLPEVAQDCSFVGDIKGFTIFFHDQYDFYTNYEYEIKVDIILYTKIQNGVVDLGNPVFCAGGSCPSLNITNYSYGPWKGPTDAFCGIGGYTEPIKYSATFTTTLNGSRGYISWNFLRPITGLQAIVLNDYEITNLSDGTGAIINNSANSIIKNDKENTDKIINSNKQTQDKIDKTNDLIEDDKIGDAQDKADDFFGNFKSDDFGLSDIITLPLSFIQGLSSATCYNLELPLPFVDTDVTLPCMTSIYQTYFGNFLTLYQIITTGYIAYWVCINIFRLVQGFKNPDNSEIEVMEL